MQIALKNLIDATQALIVDMRQRAKARGDVDGNCVILDCGNSSLFGIEKALEDAIECMGTGTDASESKTAVRRMFEQIMIGEGMTANNLSYDYANSRYRKPVTQKQWKAYWAGYMRGNDLAITNRIKEMNQRGK